MDKKNLILIFSLSLFLLTTSTIYAADVHLQWDPPIYGTPTGYRIYYGTSTGNHPIKVEVGNTTDYIVSGLDVGVTYYFVIRAYNDYYESPDSNEFPYTSSGTPPTTTVEPTYIWIHAESKKRAAPISPIEIKTDETAYCKKYIWKTEGSGDSATEPDGEASYNFEIAESGNYVVWGRVIAPDSGKNSFFTSIDTGVDSPWEIQTSNVWIWDLVNIRGGVDPLVFNLSSASHTLKIKGREDGTKLDKILLTNDMGYDPNINSDPDAEKEGLLCPPMRFRVRSTTTTIP